MKFIKSRKLKKYNRSALLELLDKNEIPIKNFNTISHLEKLINYDFSDEEILLCMQRYVNTSPEDRCLHTKNAYIHLYGEKKGLELYNEYSKNVSAAGKLTYKNGRKAAYEHFFPQYWIDKGHSKEEAEAIVNARKKKAAERSKVVFKEKGLFHNTQIEYYLEKGMTVDEAKEALKERQNTCSLKSFQKKYGEELGLQKFNERNAKWQATLNNKSDEEKQRIYEARIEGIKISHANEYVSKKETAVLNLLEKQFNIKIKRQFCIKHDDKIYLFDGKYKDIIIEFNGDFWHCNPKVYNESYYHPIKEEYASDIWKFDDFKNNVVAKEYRVFIIWESELNDKDAIIKRFELFLRGSTDK